ncbi:lipase member H-like [Apis laboriosa]|uniref:lipase member H-like n=1 Tax=Apis laboriosa TaxID=183418 RepID=UPI001CC750A3|nr:lipase member H-like [Apis laboriosa]
MINVCFCLFLVFFTFSSADTVNLTDLYFTENVFLRLYNRNGSYIDKNIRNANQLLPYIQKDNNLIFYLTGYTYDIDSDNVKMITNAYLYNTQDNILALDYRDITNQIYLISVITINKLSTFIANALNSLVNNGVNPEKIHLIGHSLGAQLAARIGRKTNFKIPRITALDPAGPLYYILDFHISSSDAKFVDVIHTDMGFYGLAVKVGHVDFFPNYGYRPQPGCKIIGPLLSTQGFNAANNLRILIKNVFLRLYNRNGFYIDKNLKNIDQLLSHVQNNNSIVFYITGYWCDINSDDVKLITNAYLNNTQDNILALDYRDITYQAYIISTMAINILGELMANALNSIVDKGVNPEKIHIIGHSLGAHLAAKISRKTKFKIPRITALDPAGPLFYILNAHLTNSDAKFVDVIHTDIGILGLAKKVGHVDFYVNYGVRPQPGCTSTNLILFLIDICSHNRSVEFYAESIRDNNAFIGKCRNQCNNVFTPMGYATSSNVKGNYDVFTNAYSPYGRGYDGTHVIINV